MGAGPNRAGYDGGHTTGFCFLPYLGQSPGGYWVGVILYLANLFGPPSPSLKALKIGALCAWLFVPWFYWIDRRRPAISIAESGTDADR
jgi:hypothetical protein